MNSLKELQYEADDFSTELAIEPFNRIHRVNKGSHLLMVFEIRTQVGP